MSVSSKHLKNNSLEFEHVKLEDSEIRSLFNEKINDCRRFFMYTMRTKDGTDGVITKRLLRPQVN